MCKKCDQDIQRIADKGMIEMRMTATNDQDNDLSPVINLHCDGDPWVLVRVPLQPTKGVDLEFNVATSTHVQSLGELAVLFDGALATLRKAMVDTGLDPDQEIEKAVSDD
jgi:hypothetical protein